MARPSPQQRNTQADSPPALDMFGRPVRSAHWRWTMPAPRAAGFPVAAWSPALLFLTPIPNLVGFEPLLILLALSLVTFWVLARHRMTPRMGMRKLLAMIRGRVTFPMSTGKVPNWDRGLMQPLQFRRIAPAAKQRIGTTTSPARSNKQRRVIR